MKIEGKYFSLQENEGSFTYVEDCDYNDGDIQFLKKLDDVAFWEVQWLGELFDIRKVEEKDGTITISAYSDSKKVFVLSKNENEFVWDIALSGSEEVTSFCRAEDAPNFSVSPCTSIHKIMAGIPESWYEISEYEGENVIFVPCEDAPGGITIDGETIDFWSGSDPYPILSMSKLFNKVTIVYQSGDQSESTIVMHEINGHVIRFGDGSDDDSRYVEQDSKDSYPTIEEEC